MKKAVQAGLITPEQAAELMRGYQALTAPVASTTVAGAPSTAAFAKLQQNVAAGAAATTPVANANQFAVSPQTQTQVQVTTTEDRQARIQGLMNAMAAQAQQLISAWQPPTMQERVGSYAPPTKSGTTTTTTTTGASTTTTTTTGLEAAPIIKAGSIIFAVLDTAINSDYPDSPVLATIVSGQYQGAKMLGKIVVTKGISGQMDRVTLNFTMMNMDAWPKSKTVTAYAIDPDTARTVLASTVNYHYMMRFGAIMATSFLQGYANAITTSSSTSTTGIFGTSTTHPSLSPGNKLAVGLGQVGQTLGNVTQNYVNIPPTVRVDAGVGLGILFMQDVT